MNNIENVYSNRIEKFTSLSRLIKKRIDFISNMRFLVFAVVVIADIFLYRSGNALPMIPVTLSGLVFFVALVIYHESLYRRLNHYKNLLVINNRCIKRFNDQWNDFRDNGEDFTDREHSFTADLDIFGPDSLFQWICSANTFSGRKALARVLASFPDDITSIHKRQAAISEISSLIDFRQNLQADSINECANRDDEPMLYWLESDEYLFKNKTVFFILTVLPWITNIAGITAFLLKAPGIATLIYTFNFLLSILWRGKIMKVMDAFEKRSPVLSTYSQAIKRILSESFNSELLIRLHDTFIRKKGDSAFDALKRMASLVNSSHVRYSGLGSFIFNMLFIWDLQCLLRMERWKRQNGKEVRKWIVALGEIEMLSTLSQIRFENPDWCFPAIDPDHNHVSAKKLGHPLLWNKKRVCNDFTASDKSVSIITGSNMSGKTTFLRTVGINYVLAFAGAPVCAETFSCCPVNLYTSMRIHDDLRANVSSFFAELIRVKKIVDAISSGERVFFLLDELFRGTNSRDRHDGAVAVLNVLISGGASGLISTHDLELAVLETDFPGKFKNLHFSERITESNITFDYHLHDGPSDSRNALAMIRLAGIPIV
ncbi:MAG: DNA mismatch repair protein [Fibrobacter sp.]|nr:DNA mismatch repair protein [Fibrobacter sp.]